MKLTKEQLVETGMELFKREGFDKVTVDRICAEAGVTKGSFYHHFKTKNELLLNYYNILLSNPMNMALNILEENDPKEQLWMAIEYSINATISLGADLLHHMLVADMSQGGEIFTPYYSQQHGDTKDYLDFVFRLIDKCQKNRVVRNTYTAKDLWFAYISGLMGIAMHWSSSKNSYDQKAELRRLFEIIFSK